MKPATVYENPVTLKNILKFAVPTIAMAVFMSFYTMVDGLFVSNLIGTDALSGNPVGYGNLHHACHRRQRGDYEKNGRAENR